MAHFIHTPDPGTSNLPSLFLHALHIALQKWEPPKTATVGSSHNKTILCALEHAAIQEGKNGLFRQLSSCQRLLFPIPVLLSTLLSQ